MEIQLGHIPDAECVAAGDGPGTVYIVFGVTPLPAESIVRGKLIIDDQLRRNCEIQIELTANAIAVSNQCSREILSAGPFYFLVPDSEAERDEAAQVLSIHVQG